MRTIQHIAVKTMVPSPTVVATLRNLFAVKTENVVTHQIAAGTVQS